MYSSIAKSSAISIATSAVAYLQSIILARNTPESDFAEYLYILAWGLFLIQFVECGTIQCLTHFARTHKKSIESCWSAISALKLAVLIGLCIIVTILNNLTNIKIPYESFLILMPGFYLGNIYEFLGNNVDYAKVVLYERIVSIAFTIGIVFLGWSIKTFYLITCIISVGSITMQICRYPLVMCFDYKLLVGQIKSYIRSYYLVFLVIISQLIYGSVSRLIIEKKIGVMSFAVVTLSLQLVNSVSMIQSQVDRHLRPLITDALSSNSKKVLKSIILKYFVFYLVPLAIVAFIVSFYSKELLEIMYGRKWIHAKLVLNYALPQLVTVASLRLIDILFTVICENQINVALNLLSALVLSSALMISATKDAHTFMAIISTCQFVQVVAGFSLVGVLINKKCGVHIKAE